MEFAQQLTPEQLQDFISKNEGVEGREREVEIAKQVAGGASGDVEGDEGMSPEEGQAEVDLGAYVSENREAILSMLIEDPNLTAGMAVKLHQAQNMGGNQEETHAKIDAAQAALDELKGATGHPGVEGEERNAEEEGWAEIKDALMNGTDDEVFEEDLERFLMGIDKTYDDLYGANGNISEEKVDAAISEMKWKGIGYDYSDNDLGYDVDALEDSRDEKRRAEYDEEEEEDEDFDNEDEDDDDEDEEEDRYNHSEDEDEEDALDYRRSVQNDEDDEAARLNDAARGRMKGLTPKRNDSDSIYDDREEEGLDEEEEEDVDNSINEQVREWIGEDYKDEHINSVKEALIESGENLKDLTRLDSDNLSTTSLMEQAVNSKVQELMGEIMPGNWHKDMDEEDVEDVLWGLIRTYNS